ncbi:MAG: hypothetical protein QOI09_448 [Chloroflexota bacterium]|nr:hypothetical protein [Chloroflexota bacterium]
MSADVVIFRAERIVPRMAIPGELARARSRAASPSTEPTELGSIEEIDHRPGWSDALTDRLAAGRARIAQLTFYMLDPDSWR